MDIEAKSRSPVTRISVSLPESLLEELDRMVLRRRLANRSQALAEMIANQIDEDLRSDGIRVMAGTITLFYDASKRDLLKHLAEIQRHHIAEVISSQHVLLEDDHTMEVLVVQGPADQLQRLIDEFLACKGVRTGKMNLSNILLPPLHGRGGK